ncbi:chemotaxis protein CheW [Faecalicatena sp. AGMB00832]|uniref:Chemotaxis protein CheW n=1 Tax=Faecalicatena faecalis TaxID=2726362 RepID=A0ABS6CY69_9FIRM|nr:chemotaxis protein CheW [Faecalicatena faecalis]MBU3874262.1 chemotaxis protein CheW [Faecalicatena faecalis]
MGIDNVYDLLCVKGADKTFAFEFSVVKELCPEMQISKMPCLPSYFAGVCNYKGEIVPVLSLKEEVYIEKRKVVIIFAYQDYQIGILCYGEPYILNTQSVQEIQKPETEADGMWTEKKLIQHDGEIVTVLDIEKIILNLAEYFKGEYLRG